jgi:hypothetical protein
MASIDAIGPEADGLDAREVDDDDTGLEDAPPPFDWSVGVGDDDFSNFFGPDHGRLNRGAIAVVGAILVVAMIVALVVGTSSGPESANAASRQTAAHEPVASTGAKATAGLLALSDLPAGWTGAGSPSVTHGPAWSKRLAACVGVPSRIANATPPKASSPVFTSADKTAALEEAVSQYATPAQALAEFKAIARAKTPRCIDSVGASALRASIQSEAGTSATVGKVAITPIPAGTLKPHETGIRVTIPLSTNAGPLTINSTEVDFVKGTLFEQINFNGNGSPFPPLLEVQLINTAMQRAG